MHFQRVYNPFRRHDVSASAGGPILKDRLFFFGSTEIKRRLVPAGTGTQTAESPDFVAYGKSINPNGIGVSLLQRFPAALVNTSTVRTAGQVLGCTNGTTTDTDNLACGVPFIITGQNPRATPDNGWQYNFRFDYTTRAGKDKVYVNYYRTNNNAAIILNRPGFDVHTTFGVLNGPGIFEQANYSFRDVVNYVHGKQSFRVGAVVRHENDKANFGLRRARPVFTFQTILDLINDNPLTETNVTFDPLTGAQRLTGLAGRTRSLGSLSTMTTKSPRVYC